MTKPFTTRSITGSEPECRFCYSKGWYSHAYQEIGSPDFPSQKGFSRLHIEQKPCRCNHPFRKPLTPDQAREKIEEAQGRKPKDPEALTRHSLRKNALRQEGAQEAIMTLLRTAVVLDYGEPYIPASAALKLLKGKGKLTMFEVKCGAV